MRALSIALAFTLGMVDQSIARAGGEQGGRARDPQVEKMLAEISTERIRGRIEKLAGFGTRHTLSDTMSETRGIGAARRWIKAELDRVAETRGGRLKVELDSFIQEPSRRVSRATELVNVVATLPGRQAESADRVYVVGGHYDSINSDVLDASGDAPGANDDASGTAVVMELAEVMSKYDYDATLVFVAFPGEEQGLYGSAHFAKEAYKANRRIEGMITNDIVGNTEGSGGARDNRSIRLFSEGLPDATSPLASRLRAVGGENDSASRQLARFIDEAASLYLPQFDVRLVFRTDRYLRGGDHMSFLAVGYPAVRLTEPSEAFERQHQNVRSENGVAFGDVPERVDSAYVASVARVNGAALASLALAPAAPQGATLVARRVENDTTIRWTKAIEPDIAGYEVVWRDTTAPLWEHVLAVGNVTEVTLPQLSKDNVHFGVRTVDRDGHASPVAYPLPPPRRPPAASTPGTPKS
jgi:hypothetical protein